MAEPNGCTPHEGRGDAIGTGLRQPGHLRFHRSVALRPRLATGVPVRSARGEHAVDMVPTHAVRPRWGGDRADGAADDERKVTLSPDGPILQ